LNNAQDYVYITTPYLIIDFNLLNALRNAALRGVDVRIITPHIPDKKIVLNLTRSYYKELLNVGIKIYEYEPGFIHAKNFISDDKVGVVGTINLDYRSLVHHYECGVFMVNNPSILDIKEDFIETQNVSIEIPKDFKLNIFISLLNYVLKFFTPLL
jgi:cardiolipin synthase